MPFSPQPALTRASAHRRPWPASLAPTCALAALLLTGSSRLGDASAARMPPSAPSAPQPRGTLHEEILRLLDSPEALPREADWARLGPEALSELLGFARNPQAPEAQRSRAVAAMAVVAHPEASLRLQELLRSSGNPASVRAAATLALGRRAGLEAIPLLTPLLSDSSEQVRATAALTLGRVGGAEVRKALEERLPLEESLAVREAIQQGLSFLEP
ncbi:HEAT repeat domain-containing protein [Archangium lansingense]|uniref:HEAT repeat domain-containing protein n=1 Tax=Archangium lansingense TaxID=2995310 RepID=A0ABT4A6B1_9BACT|nr:HEAT repeat domain-containing protein [Archangium lansinium]MCY1077155.1 HEAT repeat domain-containing protein [Archangium lansinium]